MTNTELTLDQLQAVTGGSADLKLDGFHNEDLRGGQANTRDRGLGGRGRQR